MKKKVLFQVAVLAITAGLCIAGQRPPQNQKEIAMTKCSKTPSDREVDYEEAPSKTCQAPSGYHSDAEWGEAPERRGAAKKVVQGSSPIKTQRKSAAQKVREGY